ncbi:hypothetical protein T4A_12318 [Trichinella pseudospiralis]|uniref:Uncharacterized protein n=1 Tax=Trichinella pseudospiralis TaxID=6337 RepID=A0A0V1DLF9_TRIPS|nr:hypothetical protein T4A_12318 [Trichinella pseudospiralis]
MKSFNKFLQQNVQCVQCRDSKAEILSKFSSIAG